MKQISKREYFYLDTSDQGITLDKFGIKLSISLRASKYLQTEIFFINLPEKITHLSRTKIKKEEKRMRMVMKRKI